MEKMYFSFYRTLCLKQHITQPRELNNRIQLFPGNYLLVSYTLKNIKFCLQTTEVVFDFYQQLFFLGGVRQAQQVRCWNTHLLQKCKNNYVSGFIASVWVESICSKCFLCVFCFPSFQFDVEPNYSTTKSCQLLVAPEAGNLSSIFFPRRDFSKWT